MMKSGDISKTKAEREQRGCEGSLPCSCWDNPSGGTGDSRRRRSLYFLPIFTYIKLHTANYFLFYYSKKKFQNLNRFLKRPIARLITAL